MNTNLFWQLGEVSVKESFFDIMSDVFYPYDSINPSTHDTTFLEIRNINSSKYVLYDNTYVIPTSGSRFVSIDLAYNIPTVIAKMKSGRYYRYTYTFAEAASVTPDVVNAGSYVASWGQPFNTVTIEKLTINTFNTFFYAPKGEVFDTLFFAIGFRAESHVYHPDSDNMGAEFIDTGIIYLSDPIIINAN